MGSISQKNVQLLKLFNFFNDFRPYNPIAIIYFSQATGSFALGLSVFSFQSIGAILFEVPTGIFSDMIGRKKTMVIGAFASVLSLIFFALGGSFLVLAVGGILAGLAEAFFSGNNDAFLYDTLDQDGKKILYAEVSGKVGSMFQLGLGISALIGSVFTAFPLAIIMWISVIPQLASLIIALFFIEPKVHARNVESNVFSHLQEAVARFKENYHLRGLSIISMIDFGVGEVLNQLVPAFLKTVWPLWGLGVTKSLSNFFAFLGYRYAGAIVKRLSLIKSLISGWVASRALVILAAGIPTLFSPILISITSFFFGFRMVALNTLMQKEFTDKQRATMGSLNRLGANIIFIISAYIFGSLADIFGPAQSLIIGEAVLLSTILFYRRVYRKSHQL